MIGNNGVVAVVHVGLVVREEGLVTAEVVRCVTTEIRWRNYLVTLKLSALKTGFSQSGLIGVAVQLIVVQECVLEIARALHQLGMAHHVKVFLVKIDLAHSLHVTVSMTVCVVYLRFLYDLLLYTFYNFNLPFLLAESVWQQWGSWTTCSTTCGDGTRSRARSCNVANSPCVGNSREESACNLRACTAGNFCRPT